MSWDASEEITNSEDVIDSREVIARIAALLPFKIEDATGNWTGYEFATSQEADDYLAGLEDHERLNLVITEDEDESDELKALTALAVEGESAAPDWHYGEALIRDSHFKDYAIQLADDLGYTDKVSGWPFDYIDWDAAADALKTDYTSVDFDGMTYWIR